MLTMISSLTYSQYPVVKKIGNDSIVLITIKQGQEINKQFEENRFKIKNLNDSLNNLKLDYNKFKDSTNNLLFLNYRIRQVSDSFQYMYTENKKLYIQREEFYKSERKHFAISGSILIFIAIVMSYL